MNYKFMCLYAYRQGKLTNVRERISAFIIKAILMLRSTCMYPIQVIGRFPFTKKFRKFRSGRKWETTFWFVPLEIFRNKRNS